MTDSPRIPYVLWPLAMLMGYMIACTVDRIERKWQKPKARRSADWRARMG